MGEDAPEVNEAALLDDHCCAASREEAIEKQRAGCFDEAAELFKQALALQSGQPGTSADEIVSSHKQLAKCEKHLHKFDDMVLTSTKAIQLSPQDTELFIMRAQAHESLEKYLEAKQ